jgi:integrase
LGGISYRADNFGRRLRLSDIINPPASFHILRHTYATHLLRAGAPLPVIAANLGHSDTRITERRYAHLVPSHVAQVIRVTMPKLRLVEPTVVIIDAARS